MNRLKIERRRAVVASLVEGNSIDATVRLTGVSKPTILKLFKDLGLACVEHHDRTVLGLNPKRVQTGAIWTFNGRAKNVATATLTPVHASDIFTWTALDTDTKLIIGYHVGLRTVEDTRAFMLDLAGRITNRTLVSSDGFGSNIPAVQEASGSYVDLGQLVKFFASDQHGKVAEHQYSLGKVNGTKAENHLYAIALFFAFYNFCRVHSTLKTTPAVAAGLADRAWTLDELVGLLG